MLNKADHCTGTSTALHDSHSANNRAHSVSHHHAAPTCRIHHAAELRTRVINFLAGRNLPGLRQVQVEVVGHAVTLRGRVRSFYEKQLAAHCCRRVAGVLEVIDDLHVELPTAVDAN